MKKYRGLGLFNRLVVLFFVSENILATRIHSSGMRTARLLSVSQHALGRVCVYPSMYWAGGCVSQHALGRGVCPGGCLAGGVSAVGVSAQGVSALGCLPGGCLPGECGRHPRDQRQTSPCGQTDDRENITFANFVCGR